MGLFTPEYDYDYKPPEVYPWTYKDPYAWEGAWPAEQMMTGYGGWLSQQTKGGTAFPAVSYPGARVAPLTPQELAAQQWANMYLQQPLPQQQPIWGPTQFATASLLSGAPAYTVNPQQGEDFYKAQEQAAVGYQQQYVQPTISESFAGPGYWSSARAEAETQAMEDLYSYYLGPLYYQIQYENEQARRQSELYGKQLQAQTVPYGMSMATTGAQAPATAATTGLTLGNYFRTYQQQLLEAEMQKWYEQQPVYSPYMGLMMSYLGMGQPTGTGTYVGYGAQPSLGSQMLGAGSSLLGSYLMGAALTPVTGGASMALPFAATAGMTTGSTFGMPYPISGF